MVGTLQGVQFYPYQQFLKYYHRLCIVTIILQNMPRFKKDDYLIQTLVVATSCACLLYDKPSTTEGKLGALLVMRIFLKSACFGSEMSRIVFMNLTLEIRNSR